MLIRQPPPSRLCNFSTHLEASGGDGGEQWEQNFFMGTALSSPSPSSTFPTPSDSGVRMGALYDHIFTSLKKYGHAHRFELIWGQKPLVLPVAEGKYDVRFVVADEAMRESVRRISYYGERLEGMLFEERGEDQVWMGAHCNMSANVFWRDPEWNERFRCVEYRKRWSGRGGYGGDFMFEEDDYQAYRDSD